MKKEKFLRFSVYIIAAVLMLGMMPNSGKFLGDYREGERWNHATLKAPFDVPIFKSDAEIENDRRNAEENYIPVYRLNTQARQQALSLVKAEFSINDRQMEIARPFSSNDLTDRQAVGVALARVLNEIYDKGILSNKDKFATDQISGEKLIRVDNGERIDQISINELYTRESAIQRLAEKMATLPERISKKYGDLMLANYISPMYEYDESFNEKLKASELQELPATRGIISRNEVVVSAGQLIDHEAFARLSSLSKALELNVSEGNSLVIRIGYFIIVVILMVLSYIFLRYFRTEFSKEIRNVLFTLTIYLLMALLCSSVVHTQWLNIYVIPFAIVPIFVMTFFDVRMAVFEFVVSLLFCMLIVPKPMEFFLVNFVAGIVGLFVLRSSYRRNRMFLATGGVLLASVITYTAMQMIQLGGLSEIKFGEYFWFLLSAVFLLGLYQLIYIIEKLFGFVSDITLLELSDTNQKLLLELSHKAPGTFQHSMQVANLAEAVAKVVRANPLLARTGALYHDIGKIANPEYFVENQTAGYNPHSNLSPAESAAVIRSHVNEGVALAHKNRIPKVVLEFIESHHGTSLIYYFYSKQMNLTPDDVHRENFVYPGPLPRGKEVTICMICDAVEAASRTLEEYSIDSISDLVDKIVEIQTRGHQYDQSELSLKEIAAVKEELKIKLANIYHARIAYPERGK